MAFNEVLVRFAGFVVPWAVFSYLQIGVFNIEHNYALMLYGGAAALICLSIRDSALDWWESRRH